SQEKEIYNPIFSRLHGGYDIYPDSRCPRFWSTANKKITIFGPEGNFDVTESAFNFFTKSVAKRDFSDSGLISVPVKLFQLHKYNL
ncbi:MAG: hypothetical protein QF590_07665, partial [Dehalococcoidia bacterium]|nr:hypothetical protein [Dehalococcoidia bacterium]